MKVQLCMIVFTVLLWFDHGTQASQATNHSSFPSFPFRVSYRPVHLVKDRTQNVTLTCAITPQAEHPFLFVDSIILSREHFQGGWVDLAKADYMSDSVHAFRPGYTARGLTDPVEKAYLEMEWPLAVEEMFGVYSCIVHGRDDFFQALEETSEIILQDRDCKDM